MHQKDPVNSSHSNHTDDTIIEEHQHGSEVLETKNTEKPIQQQQAPKAEKKNAEPSILTVGSQLKRLRERKGETIDSLAAKLRIGKNFIEAVEADDIACFPSLRYARAIVRSYCRTLGEQDSVLVTQFGKYSQNEDEESNAIGQMHSLDSPSQVKHINYDNSIRQIKYRFGWWIASLFVLISAFVIYFYPFSTQKVDNEEPTTTVENPPQSNTNEPLQPIASMPLAKTPNVEAVDNQQSLPVDTAPVSLSSEKEPPAAKQRILSITFSAPTWLGLFDAENKTKIDAFFDDKDRTTLEIKEGDYLKLGNFNGIVELRYQNQPIDLTPYTKNGIVKIRFGKNGALTYLQE